MAVFRCKMCGGNLNVTEGMTVCECEYCGTKQTIPRVEEEALRSLFNRANVLRMKAEFDKAAEVYERILQQKEDEAEAYWGLILCKYGIEYVEDPGTMRRIPTCHRASYESVVTDEDYKNALKYAALEQRQIYEAEAASIDEIQKGIIALARKNEPYDVFICYKESDEDGKRTQDSVIANDMYYQLAQEGFKVFYAAISLEDKLGTEYEPHIFSALNTAKVMLALGTKPEYFSAVWVKNEWSRFLQIMKKDRSKLLIPCYKGMDPYELPEEFSHLQAQDMGKIGFINDVTRGIKKVLQKKEEASKEAVKEKETIVYQQGSSGTTAAVQFKRGNMALEDHDWVKADSFFEEALNLDPECAEAYSGKLLAKDKTPDFMSWIGMQKEKYSSAVTERLKACPADTAHITKIVEEYVLAGYLDEAEIRKEYEYDLGYDSVLACRRSQKAEQLKELAAERLLTRAKQYAKGAAQKQIESGLAEITAVLDQRIAEAQEQDRQSIARVKASYEAHLAEADKKAEALNGDARNRREQCYQSAVNLMKGAGDVPGFEKAAAALKAMNGYKDSSDLAVRCQEEINRIQWEVIQKKVKKEKKEKKVKAIAVAVVFILAALILISVKVIIPNGKYNEAVSLMESGDYKAAISAFEAMDGYKDSADQITACKTAIKDGKYNKAVGLMESGDYEGAISAFEAMDGFKDSADQITACKTAIKDGKYNEAVSFMESGDYEGAISAFEAMDGYKDSANQIIACENAIKDGKYNEAVGLMKSGDYEAAISAFEAMDGYKDSADQIEQCREIVTADKIAGFANVSAGDTIIYGSYEQDNNASNGQEGIEWNVLAREGNQILVVSRYALDCRQYHTSDVGVTWEVCSFRQWLNSTFLSDAFTEAEQAYIPTVTVTADRNPEYSTSAGNDTQDQVFLLSITEAEKYFSSDAARQCEATAYAKAQGAYTSSSNGNCWWWLRSSGYNNDYAALVYFDGVVSSYGNYVIFDSDCVRPALWINLES